MIGVLVAAVLAFASTNVDDLVILLVLFARGRRARDVVVGQYLGFGALVAASLAVSAGALLLPPAWAGFLGIAPFALGVKGVVALRRGARDEGERAPAGMGVLAAAAITIANGGDNVAVYVPLFARRSWEELAAIVVVFGGMLAAWCAAAWRLVRAPRVADVFDRWGHVVAPFVLMGVGIYVFVEGGAAAYVAAAIGR